MEVAIAVGGVILAAVLAFLAGKNLHQDEVQSEQNQWLRDERFALAVDLLSTTSQITLTRAYRKDNVERGETLPADPIAAAATTERLAPLLVAGNTNSARVMLIGEDGDPATVAAMELLSAQARVLQTGMTRHEMIDLYEDLDTAERAFSTAARVSFGLAPVD